MKWPIIFLCLACAVAAYPAQIINDYIVTSLFGDTRSDHFHTGMDFAGVAKPVRAAEDVEVVFMNKHRRSAINYGNGNFVLLENKTHTKRYNYSHLADDSYDEKRILYKKSEIVGVTGDTGHSTGAHLHLEIEDIKNHRLLNPMSFIQVEDTKKPVIQDIYFVTADNEEVSFYSTRKVVRGGKLFVKCVDFIGNSGVPLVPYEISVFIDGDELDTLKFDALDRRNNDFYVTNSDKNFANLYPSGKEFTFFIKEKYFLPGLLGIKVLVKDYAGNTASFITSFTVLPPSS